MFSKNLDYPFIVNKLKLYAQLVRLDKPIGIYLLLWPSLWALAIAGEGHPSTHVLVVFILGVILMRSAGCAINDYADRKIDLLVKRTVNRPLTSGLITPKEALWVFVVLCLIAFSLVLTLNTFTIWLSFGGVILAGSYPFMKRYHHLPQVHLGAAFAWAIPMAFAAQTGVIPKEAWLLFIANVLWTTAYDTIYGMVDRDDDLKIGMKSAAILFGEYDRHMVFFLQILFILCLVLLGNNLNFGFVYYLGLLFASIHFLFQQAQIFFRLRKLCFETFLNNHWVGAIIFFGIMGHYYLN